MPRITDAINDLHVDEATFAKVYEKVMWKKLSSKVATVSDANLEKIKYVVEQLPKKDTKKAEVAPKKNDDWKFLKSGELWFWGWFLSGLGFWKQEVASHDEDEEDELQLHNIEIPWKKEEVEEDISYSAPNARVIARAEPKKKEKGDFHNDKKEFKNRQKAWWNISIEQSTYKPKEKPQQKESGLEFFADHLAAKQQNQNNENKKKWKPFKKVDKRVEKETAPKPVPAAKVHKEATTSDHLVKKTEVTIDEHITVKEFSEKIWVPLPEVMKKLIWNKYLEKIPTFLILILLH